MPIQYPSNNIHGQPGDRWTNDTDKVWYQLKVQFLNSCGQCIQYANTIARYWPIPFHPGCNCRMVPVSPGQQAEKFLDFREEVRKLPPGQQSAVMGAANLRLVEKGLIQWEDVVGRSRIRQLFEVVREQKITEAQLQAAGIAPRTIRDVFTTIRKAASSPQAQQFQQAYTDLLAQGLTPEQIRVLAVERIGAKIGLVGKLNPGGSFLTRPSPPPPSAPITIAPPPTAPPSAPVAKTTPTPPRPAPVAVLTITSTRATQQATRAEAEQLARAQDITIDEALDIIRAKRKRKTREKIASYLGIKPPETPPE
jgi:hypothetical protein